MPMRNFPPKKFSEKPRLLYTVVSETIMENIHLDLSEHEMDVMLNALEVAIENADEYEAGEYEEVLFDVQRKLDEEYDLGVE